MRLFLAPEDSVIYKTSVEKKSPIIVENAWEQRMLTIMKKGAIDIKNTHGAILNTHGAILNTPGAISKTPLELY